MVRDKQRFAQPAPDESFVDPLKTIDGLGWLGKSIRGQKLLCLGAGGGKHAALYAAAGANVVAPMMPVGVAAPPALACSSPLTVTITPGTRFVYATVSTTVPPAGLRRLPPVDAAALVASAGTS